jgi:DNA-binding HxlR family transcriptional regulator
MRRRSPTAADRSIVSAGVVTKLAHGPKNFVALRKAIGGASESTLAASICELIGEDLLTRDGSMFSLSARGRSLIEACRGRRRH